MPLRVSKIVVGLVLLDEYDAPNDSQPIHFAGDADGSAIEKVRAWLDELPAKIAAAEAASTAVPPPPNRAQRRSKSPKRAP